MSARSVCGALPRDRRAMWQIGSEWLALAVCTTEMSALTLPCMLASADTRSDADSSLNTPVYDVHMSRNSGHQETPANDRQLHSEEGSCRSALQTFRLSFGNQRRATVGLRMQCRASIDGDVAPPPSLSVYLSICLSVAAETWLQLLRSSIRIWYLWKADLSAVNGKRVPSNSSGCRSALMMTLLSISTS